MAEIEKPHVYVPPGEVPPTELVVEDLEVGDGEEATKGRLVQVHYVGVSWTSRKQFDASWDRGDTFEFNLGGGQVIGGWDQGVLGMKVGGRRQLTIPPNLGYGKRGSPPVIAPNDTLVFVVDLVGIR
jgi:peptidylprolyl isomerase